MNKRTRTFVWILLTLAIIVISGMSFLRFNQAFTFSRSILIGTLISVWVGINYTRIGRKNSLTFIHAIGILLGITLGAYPAIFSISIALAVSAVLDRLSNRCTGMQCFQRWVGIGSRQVISLAGGTAMYRWVGGELISGSPQLPEIFPTIALVAVFSVLFVSLHSVERWVTSSQKMTRRTSMLVSLFALGPIPVVIIGAVAFSVFADTALVIYGAMVVLAAPTFRTLIELQNDLAMKTRSLSALFDLATSREVATDGTNHYALIDLALAELGLAQRAALFLSEKTGEQMELVHTFNIPSELINRSEYVGMFPDLSDHCAHLHPDDHYFDDLHGLPDGTLASLKARDIKQLMVLQLVSAGGKTGELWLFFQQEQKLTNDEFDQLRLFGDQLSKSIEHSREFAATNAELKRRVEQLARLEAIGRQVTASIAIEDVYETIIYHAVQATSATSGHLEMLNPETDDLDIVIPDAIKATETDEGKLVSAAVHQLAQRAFETGQVTNVPDVSSDPEFGSVAKAPHSLLFTPIISSGETIGVITLRKNEPGGFSDDEEAFVIQLASQAGNALRNAMMYDELQQRLKEQSLLYQASAQIAESLEIEAVSLALADSLAFAVNADSAHIYRFSSRSQSLEFVMGIDGRATVKKASSKQSLGMDTPAVQACIENRRPIQWSSINPPTEGDAAHLEALGGGTILLLPLIVGQRTLGLVQLYRNRDIAFEQEELRTAQSIAIQASIILENSELFQQISQSNNRLSAVLNSTREGMLMIDKNGNIAVVNTQLKDLLNIEPDVLSGKSLDDLEENVIQKLGYRQRQIDELLSSLQSGMGHIPGISTYEIAESERQVLRRLETPVHDSEGKLIGWLVVIRDVSEEIQLEESRKHLTEMIVHDLRSPLSAILNSTELLRMQLESEEPTPILQQALAISDRSVHQMLGLVNALLDLSKLESGQFVLVSNEIDFHKLIPHLINTFLPEAEQAGVILDYRIDPEIGTVTLDEEKIFRVISNLLDNALKFTPAGGRVFLEMYREKDLLHVEVVDTGPGIPPDYRERIFDLYTQVPGTEGRRRGTGLGLAFCKLAVEAHRGQIWVEENPAGGSRFRVRMPVETS